MGSSTGIHSLTVSSRVSRNLVRFAVSRGADERALLAASGIDPVALLDLEGRVPGEQHGRLWAAAVSETGDPDLGLRLGSQSRPINVSLVGYVATSAPTLGDAYRALTRYFTLFSEGVDLRLEAGASGRLATLTLRPVGASYLASEPRQPTESVLAVLTTMARGLTGRPLPVHSVAFAHDRPATGTATHEAVFGVVPTFGAPEARVTFEAGALRWENPDGSPQLHATLRQDADDFLDRLHPSLPKRVAVAVAERLRGTVPTLAEVATDLAMGERSLRRHLKDEGTTFHDVVDGVRLEVARHHIERADATIYELAFLLGYSEPSAFHRAFKRWTGQTPAAYREQHHREMA